jgi:phospholipase/carboxylesterase
LNAEANTHFIFPNAPIQAVTINGGMKMPAWYDILEMSLNRKVDVQGIYQSANLLENLIKKEMASGISSEHILLAGFSQGGVIALHAGLTFKHKLAGIIALSTYFPTIEKVITELSIANHNTPIFMGHGILDSIVAIESGKSVFNKLNDFQYNIEWYEYVMEHSVCNEEINHISSYINQIFC